MDVHAAYEAVREHVGRSYRRELGELNERDLKRFAVAVGDDLQLTMDSDAAAEAGFPAVVAPPLYLSAVMGWDPGPSESDLRADGAAREQLAGVPVEGLRLMGAGQSLEFYGPVTAGTSVVQETRVDDVQLKEGRSGSFVLIRLERLFLSDGEPLVRCVETFIGR